jgi:tripartite-type tricarboxylate transporter receptor subunit TctC
VTVPRWLTAALLAFGLAGPAQAQSYPDHLVKLIVPQSPGGPTDLLARVTAQRLQTRLGQSVIVENRGGAGGILAAKTVMSAEPDGYTLLLGNTSVLIHIPILSSRAGYDPAKFAPVALLATSYQVIFVNPAVPAQSMQELIAYAKANPGKLNYSSAGVGNTLHLAGELLKVRAGIEMVHVPFNSGSEALRAVLSGQVQLSLTTLTTLLPLIQEGKLRALAATSPTRYAELPDVPTMIECGFPDFTVPAFFSVVAPPGTSKPVVDRLNTVINEELGRPEMQGVLEKMPAERGASSPQAFGDFIAAERAKWQAVASAAHIRID